MRKSEAALISTAAVVAAAVIGSRFGPQTLRNATWYASLDKPSYRPSGPTIGAAWGTLDLLLAYAGTRLLNKPPGRPRDLAVAGWAATVAGIPTYSWLMFGRHRLGAALGIVGLMLGSSITSIVGSAAVDRKAAGAMLPLLGWLGFAGLLQEEIWRRNR